MSTKIKDYKDLPDFMPHQDKSKLLKVKIEGKNFFQFGMLVHYNDDTFWLVGYDEDGGDFEPIQANKRVIEWEEL